MDLDSTNGTYLNGERIEGSRYYGRRGGVCFSIELREGDELRFGYSTRTYILLNENSVDTSEAKPENEVKSDHEDVLWRVCCIVCFYPFCLLFTPLPRITTNKPITMSTLLAIRGEVDEVQARLLSVLAEGLERRLDRIHERHVVITFSHQRHHEEVDAASVRDRHRRVLLDLRHDDLTNSLVDRARVLLQLRTRKVKGNSGVHVPGECVRHMALETLLVRLLRLHLVDRMILYNSRVCFSPHAPSTE